MLNIFVKYISENKNKDPVSLFSLISCKHKKTETFGTKIIKCQLLKIVAKNLW